jgi:hypothetical protein
VTEPRIGMRPSVEQLRLALVALWPDRPVVYFTEAGGKGLGPGPVLTDEERNLLTRTALAIADAEDRGRQRGVRPFRDLFAGGPDTSCRTVYREHDSIASIEVGPTECVEVPLDDVRAAFVEAGDPS